MQKLKEVVLLQNHVLTTADRFEQAQFKNGLIDTSMDGGVIKPIQRIIALGPNCYPQLNVGDWVLLNPTNYSRPVHSLREGSVLERDKDEVEMVTSWPIIDIDDEERLFIYDRDIDLIVTKFEDDSEEECESEPEPKQEHTNFS